MWPVVKDYCDNACCEVVLVRCRATGRLLAYCHDCGAGWLSPADLEVNDFGIGSGLCPQGIEVPSRGEVERSIWTDTVKRFIPEVEYSTASETNERLARERAEEASQPAWQRPPVVKPASYSRRWFNLGERMQHRILKWLGFQGRPSVLERLRQARERSEGDA
jgi:hypothetical protein